MRIFTYWIQHKVEFENQDDYFQLRTYGGSNHSEQQAVADAKRKLSFIEHRIRTGKSIEDQDYEADIREEIIEKIDADNIITRNRYGALVLNSTHLLFVDVDDYRYSLFDFFRKKSRKELMLRKIKKKIQKTAYRNFGFRVYETHNGYRILVTNKKFEARSKEVRNIMNDFNVDPTYYFLCVKQNCFRARLTPKPSRINLKRPKIKFPDRSLDEEIQQANWVATYNKKSEDFTTCKLAFQSGKPFYHRAISYHDRLSKINYTKKLA